MNAVLKPRITDAQRLQRKAAIDFARGSVRLEGVLLSAEIERLNQRYIDGELSSEEHTELCFQAMERECHAAA